MVVGLRENRKKSLTSPNIYIGLVLRSYSPNPLFSTIPHYTIILNIIAHSYTLLHTLYSALVYPPHNYIRGDKEAGNYTDYLIEYHPFVSITHLIVLYLWRL